MDAVVNDGQGGHVNERFKEKETRKKNGERSWWGGGAGGGASLPNGHMKNLALLFLRKDSRGHATIRFFNPPPLSPRRLDIRGKLVQPDREQFGAALQLLDQPGRRGLFRLFFLLGHLCASG